MSCESLQFNMSLSSSDSETPSEFPPGEPEPPNSTYKKSYRTIIKDDKSIYKVSIRDPEATVGALKSEFSKCYPSELPPNKYDLYEQDLMLNDHQKLHIYNIPKKTLLNAVMKFYLTVLRGEDGRFLLPVDDRITVGEVKDKLRETYNFPSEFVLQHPKQPEIDLDDDSTLVSVGVGATLKELIAKNVDSGEIANMDSD